MDTTLQQLFIQVSFHKVVMPTSSSKDNHVEIRKPLEKLIPNEENREGQHGEKF
jgi:hypothetical protein